MEHDCIQCEKIKSLEEDIKSLRDNHTSTREDMLILKNDMGYVKETLSDVKKIVERMADEPNQSWKDLKRQVIGFVVGGACVGFLMWAVATVGKMKGV